MTNLLLKFLTILFLIFCVGLYSCKTAEQFTGMDGPGEADSINVSSSLHGGIDLASYRNTLDDVYATQQHDIPQAFLKTYKGQQKIDDPFEGFRVQIISTRDVALADTAKKNFRVWADTSIVEFAPKAYIFFQQPHYRVHVGDFNSQERAYEFSRLVRQAFPDAWVVHDRINPYLVPADSVEINVKKSRGVTDN